MKNLNKLFAGLFIVAAFASCEKESVDDSQFISLGDKKTKKEIITENILSTPVSDENIAPFIIPGKNNGGNRTCAEVGLAFMGDAEYFDLCGDKIDYDEGSFDGAFPEGLNVTTDGKYVSFEMDGCMEIGGKYYKVGAVIVKGSNNANVYFYPEGTLKDNNLASPVNASGGFAGLSNLSFCFVECDETPELVIALKTFVQQLSTDLKYEAVSGGEGSSDHYFKMGYNFYMPNEENIYPLLRGGIDDESHNFGTITCSDYMENGIHYLELVIDTYLDDWVFLKSYLYVGTLAGYNEYLVLESDGLYHTAYSTLPFYEDEVSGLRIFKIPFSEITE